MTPITTDWSCQTVEDLTTCERRNGNSKELRISHPFKGTIFIFGFPELGTLPEKLPVLGRIAIVGWPKRFPVFNRRVVYSLSYPVLEEK